MKMMIKLLETIKIENKKPFFLEYHNERLNKARKEIFGLKNEIDLKEHLIIPADKKLYKLRVIYSKEIEKVTLAPYKIVTPKSFRVVKFDGNYNYKYLKRDEINRLKEENKDVDEIILLKENKIGDTTIANIALFLDGKWFTPKNPILEGVTRKRYLKLGLLRERDLFIQDLKKAKKIALLNAMVDFLVLDKFILKD
jgi:4-amino-4-deoxychorismate lyase